MFASEKILKENTSELETEVAKRLSELELDNGNAQIKDDLSQVFINSAQKVEFRDRGGAVNAAILVHIPYRSLGAFQRVRDTVVSHLERSCKSKVFVVASRNIVSRFAKRHRTQKRPRSRTLTSVHEAILEDLAFPATIQGKNTRVRVDGSRHMKVLIDPLDKERMEDRLDAMSEIYRKLTTKRISFDFAKPNSFVKKVIEAKAKQAAS